MFMFFIGVRSCVVVVLFRLVGVIIGIGMLVGNMFGSLFVCVIVLSRLV